MKLFQVAPSPHIRHEDTTRILMADVLIALFPALIWGAYLFGLRALTVCAASVAFCLFFEALIHKLMKRPNPTGDLSAAVSGLLLAFSLPPAVPLWTVAAGAFFAMVVVKGLFGGIGKNIVNPALAARVFLGMSWPGQMTGYTAPLAKLALLDLSAADAVSAATALPALKDGALPETALFDLLIGKRGGCIGEVSALLLLAGGVYLLVRRVISWHIPVSFLGTVAFLTFFFPRHDFSFEFMSAELLTGGLILGAVFMATDYATSPATGAGRLWYGAGCGALTVLIRYFGGYPEGVSFAILIMNLFVWYLDRAARPKGFGGEKS